MRSLSSPALKSILERECQGRKGLQRSTVNSALGLANKGTEAKKERVARIARVFKLALSTISRCSFPLAAEVR